MLDHEMKAKELAKVLDAADDPEVRFMKAMNAKANTLIEQRGSRGRISLSAFRGVKREVFQWGEAVARNTEVLLGYALHRLEELFDDVAKNFKVT